MSTIERKSNGPQPDKWLITPGNTIFLASKQRKVSDLEGHLKIVRARYGVSQRDVAKEADISHGSYKYFELDIETKPDEEKTDKLLNALGRISHEDDPNAIAAVTILTASQMSQEQRERISDLLDDSRFEGTTVFELGKERTRRAKYKQIVSRTRKFGKALQQMRRTDGLTIVQYAKRAGIAPNHLGQIERGKVTPHLSTINLIIEASPFSNRDPYAQIMRFRGSNIDIMHTNKIPQIQLGQIVRYLRIADGLTQQQLGKVIRRPQETIDRIERLSEKPRKIEDDIKRWLQGDPVEEILQCLINNKPITDALARNVLYGNYVFASLPFPKRNFT